MRTRKDPLVCCALSILVDVLFLSELFLAVGSVGRFTVIIFNGTVMGIL